MAPNIPKVDVLGAGISAIDMAWPSPRSPPWIKERARHDFCVTGVHGVMECQRDPELLRIHYESRLTTPHGMPLVWCARWGEPATER